MHVLHLDLPLEAFLSLNVADAESFTETSIFFNFHTRIMNLLFLLIKFTWIVVRFEIEIYLNFKILFVSKISGKKHYIAYSTLQPFYQLYLLLLQSFDIVLARTKPLPFISIKVFLGEHVYILL